MMRTRECFRISSLKRICDKITGKFTISIAHETVPPKPSTRVVAVAEGFGRGLNRWKEFVPYGNVEGRTGQGGIV